MADHSFDVVSKVDLQEVRNAFSQAEKEIATRYDLKRVDARLALEGEEIVAESADESTLEQALDVLRTKLVRPNVHLKSLRPGKVEPASGAEREVPPHPYLHREGVNRCAACWRDRLHPSHTETTAR